jgi:hypothetical protein
MQSPAHGVAQRGHAAVEAPRLEQIRVEPRTVREEGRSPADDGGADKEVQLVDQTCPQRRAGDGIE